MNKARLKQLFVVCIIALSAYTSFCSGQTTLGDKVLTDGMKELVPGPLLEERKKIYQKIRQSKQQGIGITTYLSVFAALEQQINSGASTEQISKQIKSLDDSLSAQLIRSKALKIQRPLPVESNTNSNSANSQSKDTTNSNADVANKILKLKEKYKDNLEDLPFGITPNNLPDNLTGKLKDAKTRKELLEKLQGI